MAITFFVVHGIFLPTCNILRYALVENMVRKRMHSYLHIALLRPFGRVDNGKCKAGWNIVNRYACLPFFCCSSSTLCHFLFNSTSATCHMVTHSLIGGIHLSSHEIPAEKPSASHPPDGKPSTNSQIEDTIMELLLPSWQTFFHGQHI